MLCRSSISALRLSTSSLLGRNATSSGASFVARSMHSIPSSMNNSSYNKAQSSFVSRKQQPNATLSFKRFFSEEKKSDLSPALEKQIEGLTKSNTVVLFMKGNADAPMCGFSNMVVQILKREGVQFDTVDILQDNGLREGLKKYSNWPTFPQLYVGGELVGGCDITVNLWKEGELTKMLKDAGAKYIDS